MGHVTQDPIVKRPQSGSPEELAETKFVVHGSPLAPGSHARLEAFRQFVREKEEAYANLSEAEKRQLDVQWELLKKSMNESHAGYRVPFPDAD